VEVEVEVGEVVLSVIIKDLQMEVVVSITARAILDMEEDTMEVEEVDEGVEGAKEEEEALIW